MSSPASSKPLAPRVFDDALREFKKQLPAKDLAYFEAVGLQDVEETIKKIELEQRAKRRMQNLTRIQPFLQVIAQYGKVIEVFLNASTLIAFVWGPIKFLLNVASTYLEAFDMLLSAYEELAECLPLYTQYESHFHNSPYMYKALGYVYKDFLNFHLRVYKLMKSCRWREIFSIAWSGFQPALLEIRTSLLRHKSLVENQASLLQFEEFRKAHEAAEGHFQQVERAERLRQTHEILEWLGMTGDSSPTTDHEHFTNIWRNYSSSGQWLHNCNGYRKLCDPNTDVPVVWLHGIPGSGKTVLSSYIIERLREIPQFTVGWFYCRFGNKEKNTLLAVTRGILAQLLRGNDRLRPLMLKARQETDAAKLVSTDLAQELMRQCLEELQKSCVVIDGLDECDREERKKTMAIYTKLVKQLCNNLPTSVRVLFVSTDENDIRIHFTKAELIHLTAADNYVEMRDYARTWSKKIQELHQLSHQETEAMTLDVLRRANGMYLFCYLVLNNLLGQLTREDLDRELQPDNLPNGLGDAYEKILRGIDTRPQQAYRLYARKILGWVSCAKRALRWHEIQGALCLGNDGQFDMERRRLRVSAKDVCGALIEVYSDGTVEFVHLTAREYIIRHRTLQSELGEKELEPWIDIAIARFDTALACVQYLSLDCFNTQLTDEQVRNFVHQGFYCLQDYAVAHWYDHVQSCLDMAARTDLSKSLQTLQSNLVVFLSRRWDGSTEQRKGNKRVPIKIAPKLRLLKDPRFQGVFLKLTQFQATCEDLPADARIPFLNFSTQVHRARIFLECEQQLRSNKLYPLEQYYGPKFGLFKCSRENCLYFAEGFQTLAERDEHELKHERPFTCPEVACLQSSIGFSSQCDLESHIKLQHPESAHIHRQQEDTFDEADSLDDASPFIVEAAEEGHSQIVQKLVHSGTDANVRDMEGMTALHRASANGHVDIVRFLACVPGIIVSSPDANHSTALHLAAHSGHARVVALLLSVGADASLSDNRGRTALHVALITGNLGVVDIFLDKERHLDVTSTDVDGKCPLSMAAEMGYVDVVTKLLSHVQDCDKDTTRAKIAVLKASREGHLLIVQALYLHSSRDEQDRYFYDALREAGGKGHLSAVRRLLLVANPSGTMNPTVQLKLRETRLLAAENGQTEMVKYLLNLCSSDLETAELTDLFHAAVHAGDTCTVELLLRKFKANHASLCNYPSTRFKLGLERNVGIHALVYAAQEGFQGIMQLLLDFSSDLDHDTIRKAFLAAISNGHPDTVLDITTGITTLCLAFTSLGAEYYTQALEAHVNNTNHAFNAELIRVLVVHGARVPLVLDTEQPRQTWLHHATEHGMIEPVRLLTGCDPKLGVVVPISTINDTGTTALDIAAAGLKVEILRYLLEERHARLTIERQRHILFDVLRVWPICTLRRSDIAALNVTVRLLFQYHEELHVHTGAIMARALELLKHLDMGSVESPEGTCDGDEWFALLMVKCNLEDSVLIELVKYRRTAYVRLLLEKRKSHVHIDALMQLNDYGTPLDYACYKGFLEMVRVLLDHGANSSEPRWGRALCAAAHCGYACIMKLLLEHGANPNEKSGGWQWRAASRSTPLHNIVRSGRVADSQQLSKSILQILLERVSTGSLRTSHEYRVGEEQDMVDYELAARVLLDHGADTMAKDTTGWTPIGILRTRSNTLQAQYS